jgi:hypothetical protein
MLGPLLFCLVLRLAAQKVQAATQSDPLDLHSWYLHDGLLIGRHSSLAWALDILQSPEVLALGLHLNLSKCVLLWPEDPPSATLQTYIAGLPEFGMVEATILGSPIGCDEFIADKMSATLPPLVAAHKTLAEMDCPQIELLLHRASFSACKVTHLCRTVPPPQFGLFATSHDAAVGSYLSTVLQSAVADPAWDQAGLSLARGGLGLAHASNLSAAAFLASI